MRYPALACDYDGTIATHGRVDPDTVSALGRFAASGRQLILVTGRELPELCAVFPEVSLFASVVAENGALLYRPSDGHQEVLGSAPSVEFVTALRERGVDRLSVGKAIVATWEPHEVTVFKTIHDMGLELQVIFNKGAVMVLPAGVNKATGLKRAVRELGLSLHEVVGVGDAENDHAFLSVCECSAAVANALPAVKEHVDLVTAADHGAGVTELIELILADDLARLDRRLTRHDITIGVRDDGTDLRVNPAATRRVVVQQMPQGIPAAAARFLERLALSGYQIVILSSRPHGLLPKQSIALGAPERPPTVDELLKATESPRNNPSVDLAAMGVAERAEFMAGALSGLAALRRRKGRPHWIIVMEPQQLLAVDGSAGAAIEWPGNRCLMIASSLHGLPPEADAADVLFLAGDAGWLEPLLGDANRPTAPLADDETLALCSGAVVRVQTLKTDTATAP